MSRPRHELSQIPNTSRQAQAWWDQQAQAQTWRRKTPQTWVLMDKPRNTRVTNPLCPWCLLSARWLDTGEAYCIRCGHKWDAKAVSQWYQGGGHGQSEPVRGSS